MTEYILFIDSRNQKVSVEEVTRKKGESIGLKYFYDKMGCDYVDIHGMHPQNGYPLDLVIDDEGIYNSPDRGFVFLSESGHEYQICGNAIVCSNDSEGNSVGFQSIDHVPNIKITDWFFSL